MREVKSWTRFCDFRFNDKSTKTDSCERSAISGENSLLWELLLARLIERIGSEIFHYWVKNVKPAGRGDCVRAKLMNAAVLRMKIQAGALHVLLLVTPSDSSSLTGFSINVSVCHLRL